MSCSAPEASYHPPSILSKNNNNKSNFDMKYFLEQLHLIVHKEATALPDILTVFDWSSFSSSISRQGSEDHVVI